MTETIFREMLEKIHNSERAVYRKKTTLLKLCGWRLVGGRWNKKGTTCSHTLEEALIVEENSWD